WERGPCYRGRDRARQGRQPRGRSLPRSTAGGAAKVGAAAGLAEEFAVVDDEFAAGENLAGVAAHAEALEHGVVHAHVMGFGADEVLGFGIPDDEVGVAARG